MSFLATQCKFTFIKQPKQADPNQVIEIQLQIEDTFVPEPNPHKGVICILTPKDWQFVSGEYSFSEGSGIIEYSQDWTDSATACFPPNDFEDNMKWIGLISDSGYTYQDPIYIDVTIRLQVGEITGCFNLAYLTTKATSGLLCSGNSSYVAFSYPHRIGIPDSTLCDPNLTAEPAPDWNQMFTRTSGWTGADGIYSIPVSGSEIPHEGTSGLDELFVFSDTFIGDVDENKVRHNAVLVNNTMAFLTGQLPVTNNITFQWGLDNQNKPQALFIPNTPESKAGDWYWLMDGIKINNKYYVYALRLETGEGGFFNFKVIGVNLISFELGNDNSIINVQQMDTPLFQNNSAQNGDLVFGQALMPMTEISSNPNPDGYIYIYAPYNTAGGKQLKVGRFLPENIENFVQYEYWNGSNWVNDINQAVIIANKTSQELSVTPLTNGKFLLVFQMGNSVAVSLGNSPAGPFNFPEEIYNCPEPEEIPNTFVYNAKAHPNLSEPGKLLISYNVNTFDFGDLINNADTYRPRFITFDLNQIVSSVKDAKPVKFRLSQNYPNPFNAYTNINFNLPERSTITIRVINVLGQLIETVVDNKAFEKGEHTINWSPKNLNSGVYLCQIKSEKYKAINKMVYLK